MLTAQVRLPYTTALPRDVAITTWRFAGADVDDATTLDPILIKYWNTVASPATNPVGAYIAELVNRPACSIRWYLSAAGEPAGDPIKETVFTLAASLTTVGWNLPLEVALVQTIVGEGSEPIRNRRGRQFIGPFNGESVSTLTATYPAPTPGLISAMVAASDRLQAEAATAGLPWLVFSEKLGTASEVGSGWVDNDWDTQRRRGVDATARTAWTNIV